MIHKTIFLYVKVPQYRNWAYDIAVIVLKPKVVLSSKIKIANLPKEDSPCPKGRSLVTSGWGADFTRPFRPRNNLWAVMQECFNVSSCPVSKDYVPRSHFLCVGDPENILNSDCFGDSGGKCYCKCKLCKLHVIMG